MAIELTDDGTMDTVLRCSECGEEMRYSTPMDAYDATDGPCEHGIPAGGDGCIDCREAWIEELIVECSDEHVCYECPDCKHIRETCTVCDERTVCDCGCDNGCAVDDDDESAGPQDEDLVTSDHVHFYSHGGPNRLAFELQETSTGHYRVHARGLQVPGQYATVERAIRAYMQASQFWPNCWFISDHGNAHLMDLERA